MNLVQRFFNAAFPDACPAPGVRCLNCGSYYTSSDCDLCTDCEYLNAAAFVIEDRGSSAHHASRLTPIASRLAAVEFNSLAAYPGGGARIATRTIRNKLAAMDRGEEFFDGARGNGYGGYMDDGRWAPVARFMADHYRLPAHAKVLQIQCEMGFLLKEFEALGMQVQGQDSSWYAIQRAAIRNISLSKPLETPVHERFDLVIALGVVYTLALPDAVRMLRKIQRLTRSHAFVTLAAYESEDDLRLLRAWSLLGTTILTKDDWREVMGFAGYTGDYSFVTAKTLNLKWA